MSKPSFLFTLRGMANPKHPFGLGKDQRRKEKKGGAAALPASAAGSSPGALSFDSGVQALSTLGRAAPTGGGQAGLWEALVSGLSKATGLGAVAASKAIVVGLVVAASSVAAGVSLYIGNSTPSSAPSFGRRVFVDSASEEEPVKLAKVSAPAEAQTSAGSLEYLAEGNAPAPEPAAAPERASDAPAAAPEVTTAETPNHDAPAAATVQVKDPGPRPQLAKRAMPQSRGEPGGSARLEAVKSLTGKVGAGFQDVYRPQKTGAFDATSQSRAAYGSRRSVLAKSGSNAMSQAKFANRMSRSGSRMGSATGASHSTSLPFDGANTAAALGATKPGGAALGGTGVASSANGVLDSKSVEPPPAPESKKNENKTPYQGLIMAAIAALMIGTVLLMLAGKMSGEAKKCANPADCAAKLQAAKMLAMAAMAAGGAAAAMGGMLAGQYGQMSQGLPFIMGGGMIAVQAGMVLMKDDKASEEANSATDAGVGQLGQAANALQPQQDKVDSSPKTETPKKYDIYKKN